MNKIFTYDNINSCSITIVYSLVVIGVLAAIFFTWGIGGLLAVFLFLLIGYVVIAALGFAMVVGLRDKYPLDYLMGMSPISNLFKEYGFTENDYINEGTDNPALEMKYLNEVVRITLHSPMNFKKYLLPIKGTIPTYSIDFLNHSETIVFPVENINENLEKIRKTIEKIIGLEKMPEIVKHAKEYAIKDWNLGKTHGLSHWERVERNGIILSMQIEDGTFREDVNIKVVRLFAYLHDKCRENDGSDLEHGERAADMLHTIRDTLLKDLNEEEFALLEQACRLHTTTHKTGNPTIDVCFDADRLDLGRVGIKPCPNKMATKQGEYYAMYPHKFERTINRIKI